MAFMMRLANVYYLEQADCIAFQMYNLEQLNFCYYSRQTDYTTF